MIVQLRAVVCGLRSHTGLCEIVRPFPHQVDVFCQDQVSTNQRKSKKNLPPHVCRSFLSNIHNLKNQSETQLLRRHQESQPGNHALLKIHLASQCLYAYPTSEKKKLSENQLQSTTETLYHHQESSKYGWVDPTISEELESNHLAINVSPLWGFQWVIICPSPIAGQPDPTAHF